MNNLFLFLYSVDCSSIYIATNNLYNTYKIPYQKDPHQKLDMTIIEFPIIQVKRYNISIWRTDNHVKINLYII